MKDYFRKNKAITLIALVITIVVLIILAGVTINLTIGEDGIFNRAKQAKEQTLIAQHQEQIELVRAGAKMNNIDNMTLEELKNAFDNDANKNWVNSTEIITDDGVEKIKLITNDGYIFYVADNKTEYKGKGKIENPPVVTGDITAEMVSFTPQDTSWNVKNVKEALDYLYNN